MRNRQNLLRNKSLTFWGHLTGRLFLWFIFILAKGISKTKAGQAEARYCYKINNTHGLAILSSGFSFEFLCNQRVTGLRFTLVVAKRVL